MRPETTVFLLAVLLGISHIFIPVLFAFAQNGMIAAFGPRDNAAPLKKVIGLRAERASANYRETLPMALGLLILVQVLGKVSGTSAMGAWIYLGARVIYLPLYLFGIPYLRTLVWFTSLVGLFMVAMPIFM